MKICFVTTGDINSLATIKRATGMASPLISMGHRVSIIAWDTKNNRERFNVECPLAEILYIKPSGTIAEILQKQKIIKQWQPNVIYVCAIGFRNWIHRFNSKADFIVVEHSELVSSVPFNNKRLLYKFIEKLSINIFDGQIYASRYLEDYFNNTLGNTKPSIYSPYAYNKNILTADVNLFNSLKKKYSGKKVILYMGTLALNYGFLEILKAVEILKSERSDFILLILGSGQHKIYGENYIKNSSLENYAEMLGYIPENDISAYFKLADAFISPLYDTIQDRARCPSKLFMYLPFKKPIITCKIGEAYELLGEDGSYFKSGDIQSLKDEINYSLDHKLEVMYRAIESHSWDSRASQFNQWLKSQKN